MLIVDYKSDAAVPAGPETMPPGYLRQLGLYRFAARMLFHKAVIDAAILWTETSALMPIPEALLDAAVSDVTTL